MDIYDKKYGIDSSDSSIKLFHVSRRMFAIKENKLFLAPENVDYSHAKWFEIKGWISPEDDSLMDTITRGYFDSTGIYFYKGYDFRIDKISKEEMFLILPLLVRELKLDVELHLFEGKGKKDYGSIKDLLEHH